MSEFLDTFVHLMSVNSWGSVALPPSRGPCHLRGKGMSLVGDNVDGGNSILRHPLMGGGDLHLDLPLKLGGHGQHLNLLPQFKSDTEHPNLPA